MTDSLKRKVPLDIHEEIDEKLVLLHLALESENTGWTEEIKKDLAKLVDIKKTLDYRIPKMEEESKLYW